MHLLEKYIQCLADGDAEKVASLFTKDAVFFDEGPKKMGMEPFTLKGRKDIKALFEQVFSSQGPVNTFNVVINGNAMRYDLKLGDSVVFALGLMREENNLIAEYQVNVL
jgi:uncharacterized protein (TIGR02246 family)